MITYCDKRHRIKHRLDGTCARPQWKGLFFWHDYKFVPLDIFMGPLALYGSPKKVEYDEIHQALRFLHRAIENERNGTGIIGIVQESAEDIE